MKILVASGGAGSLSGFCLPFVKQFVEKGNEVVAIACDDDAGTASTLSKLGIRFVPFGVGRASINPFLDLLFIIRLTRFLRREHFDLAFLFQQKAVLYGGIAAKLARVPKIFAMLTGLGYAFTPNSGLKFRVVNFGVCVLYKIIAKHFDGMLFQNPDDIELISTRFLKNSSVAIKRIYGLGVDLDRFAYTEKCDPASFLFVGRLIAAKGIYEYIEAGKILATQGKKAELRILGGLDINPSAIKEKQVREWESSGACRWLGTLADVRPAVAAASVFVLPSYYREGTPQSAMEAMATGRPIVTTNSPGCRETVFFEKVCQRFDRDSKAFVDLPVGINPREHLDEILMGDNGFLVPVKNPEALATAMAFYLEKPEMVAVHGRESRRLAEKFYVLKSVTNEICSFVGVR